MSDLPTKATIYEVGPREGFQFEKSFIPTERKIELVKALTETGVKDIEVTSFVHPEWVPQMADAEAFSAGCRRCRASAIAASISIPRGSTVR